MTSVRRKLFTADKDPGDAIKKAGDGPHVATLSVETQSFKRDPGVITKRYYAPLSIPVCE